MKKWYNNGIKEKNCKLKNYNNKCVATAEVIRKVILEYLFNVKSDFILILTTLIFVVIFFVFITFN